MTPRVRRPLSPAERWFWIADQISPLNVIARVRLTGHIPDGTLARAAANLAAEYPLLRVAIRADDDGANPAFVPVSRTIPIHTVRGDDTEWERLVDDHELSTAVDWRSGPLVRIVDVSSDAPQEVHDLILTVSHIIADATTALSLLQRLVVHADRLSVTCGDDLVESRAVVGAPEDLLPARFRRPWAIASATGLADQLAAVLAGPGRLTPEARVAPSRRRTRLVRRTLTSTHVDTLMRRCREEGVTVHGALAAAMAMAIGPTAARRASGRICIGSPINFRAELTPPIAADEAGCYVATVPSIVRFGGDRDLWSTARRINRSLRRRTQREQHLAVLFALRFICPASVAKSSKVFGLMERSGIVNVCISNVGRYGFAARIGDWRLSGAQFTAGLPSSSYFLATVNTSHDELFWNFSFADGAVSQRSARRFADGLRPEPARCHRLSKEVIPLDVLARWLARYAGWIVAVVLVLLVLCGLYSVHLSSRLSGGGWTVPGSEEARAERAQDAGFIGRGSSSVALLVHDDKFSAPSPEFDQRVAGVIQQVTSDPRLQIRSHPGWRSLTGAAKG